jgi:hypothetical protein
MLLFIILDKFYYIYWEEYINSYNNGHVFLLYFDLLDGY